jgi:hypothetical protein
MSIIFTLPKENESMRRWSSGGQSRMASLTARLRPVTIFHHAACEQHHVQQSYKFLFFFNFDESVNWASADRFPSIPSSLRAFRPFSMSFAS